MKRPRGIRLLRAWERVVAGTLVLATLTTPVALAADSPQFRGLHRDGRFVETSLLKKWPIQGPKELWSVDGLGKGYATVSVVDGLIYSTGMVGKEGVLFALDLDGNLKWQTRYGPEWAGQYAGARSTPTVDEGRVYIVSGQGALLCFDAKSGEQQWSRDASKIFKGDMPPYGIAESVLIDGNNAICTPGGSEAFIVAYSKKTGELVWACRDLKERQAYCAPILIEQGGTRQIVVMSDKSTVGIEADSGKLIWRVPHKVRAHMKIVTDVYANSPVHHSDLLYIAKGYRNGGNCLRLSGDGRSVVELWYQKAQDTHHGGIVLVDGYLYGSTHLWGKPHWVCVELKTGKVMYEAPGVGKGSVVFADGMLYCCGENGIVALVQPSPEEFSIVSQFTLSKGSGPLWAHPTICDGRLYLRRGDMLLAFDITAKT